MPTLPVEVEREIFEWAVRSDCKNAANKLNLSLVAQRVQLWVDLIFYESVTISSNNGDKFTDLFDLPKYQGFFARTVKILTLPYLARPDQIWRILSVCTGVQMLGCWFGGSLEEHSPWYLHFLLSQLPLRRLSIEYIHFATIPSTSSTWLSSPTHLDLSFWEDRPLVLSDLKQSLHRLPRLTHAGLSFSTSDQTHAEVICSGCANLQLLLNLSSIPKGPRSFARSIHPIPVS
ncbi:hypothetical protein FB451DRAFT_1020958 [Mycena latifolia]|nr:hypothetical protein FB451DRAFT_1020958 [Mycena latifolia]